MWLLASAPALAQFGMEGAPYSRTRPGAEQWSQRGDGYGFWGRGQGGFNPYFYGHGFSGPIVQGSWYQRPYPYHFDYYRHRWGGPDQAPQGQMMPVAECPCLAAPPPVETVQ